MSYSARVRALVVLLALAACEKPQGRDLDLDAIRVSTDARLRTDTVGDGKFTDHATFVLVDAENAAREGAYVTLGGELADQAGVVVGKLRSQSLWIPPGEQRTFALVDSQRQPRPTAAAAKIKVSGARVPPSPPRIRVEGFRELVDNDKIVVQATVANDSARDGKIIVIASFHDADGRPMTRPFSLIDIRANAGQAVQFVGPVGSKHGAIYFGDATF